MPRRRYSALADRIFRTGLIEFTVERFNAELQKRLTEIQKQSELTSRGNLEVQAKRLAEAIAVAGHSPTLLTHLATTEEKSTP